MTGSRTVEPSVAGVAACGPRYAKWQEVTERLGELVL
jgi:hypothetical protein